MAVQAENKLQSLPLALDIQHCERVNPQTGLVEYLTALHPAWCADVRFLPYVPPTHEGGEVEAMWVESMELIDGDLHWLLQLPHQTFWSQVIYDTTLHTFLDTYLRYAPRSYDGIQDHLLKVQETLRNIHRRVFMVFLRMATHKESTEHFLSPEAFGDIIYEHFLFDIPKLLDLCVLYGGANKALLGKMMGNVFEKQPKYSEDWRTCVQSILKLLERAQSQVCSQTREKGEKTMRLDEVWSLSPLELSDLVLYLADIAATLCSFVDVYPPASSELAGANFPERIAAFYETVVPALQALWHSQKHRITNMDHVKARFRQLKHDLTWLVNHLLHTCYISSEALSELPSSSSSSPAQHTPEAFLAAVTTILSEKWFLREFEKHFSLGSCVQQLQRKHPNIDEAHFEYVLSALGVISQAPSLAGATSVMTGASPLVDGPEELQSLVSHVKDLLPHLGDGFIEECLREFGNNSEEVISRVLDGTLPPRLLQMDQGAPRKHLEAPVQELGMEVKGEGAWSPEGGEGEEDESLLDQRSSVFDRDEFDVFRRKADVDLSRVHIGKRFDASTLPSLLDDKSHLDSTRELYKAYEYGGSYEEDEGEEVAGAGYELTFEYDQYNDEYDDTYDSHHVAAADTVSTEELFSVRRLNEKGLYRRRLVGSSEEEEEEEEETREGAVFNVGGAPVRGAPLSGAPVRILRRGDVPRPAAGEDRSGGGGEGTWKDVRGTGAKARHTDQVHHKPEGNPPHGRAQKPHDRGRGEAIPVRARQLKERHKGSHGNHNRRDLADKKRRRGMGAPPRT